MKLICFNLFKSSIVKFRLEIYCEKTTNKTETLKLETEIIM